MRPVTRRSGIPDAVVAHDLWVTDKCAIVGEIDFLDLVLRHSGDGFDGFIIKYEERCLRSLNCLLLSDDDQTQFNQGLLHLLIVFLPYLFMRISFSSIQTIDSHEGLSLRQACSRLR